MMPMVSTGASPSKFSARMRSGKKTSVPNVLAFEINVNSKIAPPVTARVFAVLFKGMNLKQY